MARRGRINLGFLSGTVRSVGSHNKREEIDDCWRERKMEEEADNVSRKRRREDESQSPKNDSSATQEETREAWAAKKALAMAQKQEIADQIRFNLPPSTDIQEPNTHDSSTDSSEEERGAEKRVKKRKREKEETEKPRKKDKKKDKKSKKSEKKHKKKDKKSKKDKKDKK